MILGNPQRFLKKAVDFPVGWCRISTTADKARVGDQGLPKNFNGNEKKFKENEEKACGMLWVV